MLFSATGTTFLFGAGVALHLAYFRRGEHHMYGVRYVKTFGVLCTVTPILLSRLARFALPQALAATAIWITSLLAGIYTSLIVYRLLWHPLRRFPGPVGARLSSLWFSFHSRNADAHKRLLALHRHYGPFVRIGPNDLSIAHPSGVEAVYGFKSTCTKSSWYDEDWPRQSVHTTRDPQYHRQRRRVWSNAFSDRALRAYEARVVVFNARLVAKLGQMHGRALDASHWIHWWAFDVMGDLTFGRDFGMLQNAQGHWAVELFCEAMELQALHLPTWLVRILVAIPGMAAKYWSFIKFCDDAMLERVSRTASAPDLSSTLLPQLEKAADKDAELTALLADARTAIVAGSDTTASALVHVIYYLTKDPKHIRELRAEIESLRSVGTEVNNVSLQKLPYLTGVINEALRLHPVVPSIMQRKTTAGGIVVAEKHIPGNVNVCCPQYVLSRDESIYRNADQFIPERWSPESDLIGDKSAYAPFSSGMYACIGRPLALLELRTAIASLVSNFDIVLAPGEMGNNFIDQTKDHFTLAPAGLRLCFRPVDKAQSTGLQ